MIFKSEQDLRTQIKWANSRIIVALWNVEDDFTLMTLGPNPEHN